MQKFSEILLSDLKTVVEARAAELKMPMNVVFERIQVSESDWAKADDLSVPLNVARAVGIEVAPSCAQGFPHDSADEYQLGAAVEPQSPQKPKDVRFPVLRPSGPCRRITMDPSWTPPPPAKPK
jgi:hypothetical protein